MQLRDRSNPTVRPPRAQASDPVQDKGFSVLPDTLRQVITTRLARGMLPRRCPVCKGTLNRSGRQRQPVTFVVTYRGDRWQGVEVYHEGCQLPLPGQ
jgi:hypothetical protein